MSDFAAVRHLGSRILILSETDDGLLFQRTLYDGNMTVQQMVFSLEEIEMLYEMLSSFRAIDAEFVSGSE